MSKVKQQEELQELTQTVENLSEQVRALQADGDIDRRMTATCICGQWRCCQAWTISGEQPWWYKQGSGGRDAQRKVFCYDCNTLCRPDGSTVAVPTEEAKDE